MESASALKNADWDRRGLPAWTYQNSDLLDLERSELFHAHWQIAGHICDIPNSGDYFTLDICNERAVIIRGDDGVVRAFHNLCRHRGSRVAAGEKGHCKNALVCPFHGWVYNLDGTLRGAARPSSFGELNKHEFGLRPVELEIWHGFIFIRFKPGPQPTVELLLAPLAEELKSYRLEMLLPTGPFWNNRISVNWKSVRDVDNEGYHVALAHPGLQDLYGPTYYDIPSDESGLSHSRGQFSPHAGRTWSVRNYVKMSATRDWLPDDKKELWSYHGIFPNNVFAITPEGIQFYQEFPVNVGETVLRGATYRQPDEGRSQRVARYLAYRIDRQTYKEDIQLSMWSNESMKSSAFTSFHLSDLEKGVRAHHDHIRRILPVVTIEKLQGNLDLAQENDKLKRTQN